MRTAITAVASVKFRLRLEAALGVKARRDRKGLVAAKRIRRIRQPDETEQVSSPQSESEGFAGQTRPNRSRRRKAYPQDSPVRPWGAVVGKHRIPHVKKNYRVPYVKKTIACPT